MKRKKMNPNNFLLLLLLFAISCSGQKIKKKQEFSGKVDMDFKEYLISKKIPFRKLNDSIYSAYFLDYLDNEKKSLLKKNLYLKVNKVYVHYRTPNSVEFSVYSDNGTFCLSTFDLNIDGEVLSFPKNGVVTVLKPVTLEFFGDFEINSNVIKTRKRSVTPFNETYSYVNGTIKNDTIHYTEKYIGKEKKFEKKLFAKTHKLSTKEVYQPNLKAVKFMKGRYLTSYEVTGEFNIENKEEVSNK